MHGTIGIGHTRWATHGLPTEDNAHPIATDRVAVVHNGIIENFQALKRELTGLGHASRPQTDTEAVAILATHYLAQGLTPAQAVAKTLARLEGAFALVFLFAGEHDLLICARRGSPLAIGYGDGEMFIGSDALALAPLTRRITYLDEGDWAVVTAREVAIFDRANQQGRAPGARDGAVRRADRQGQLPPLHAEGDLRAAGGDRRHAACADQPGDAQRHLPELPFALGDIGKITIDRLRHRAITPAWSRKYWLERIARIPVEVDIASEFRYRAPAMPRDGAALFISQSGETADTLAALRYCRDAGPEDHRDRQPAGKLDRARGRHRAADPGRAGDRRRLDQGVHDAARRARRVHGRDGAGARHDRRGRARRRSPAQLAEIPSRASEVLHHDERIQRDRRARSRRPATCSISAAAPPIRWRSKAR